MTSERHDFSDIASLFEQALKPAGEVLGIRLRQGPLSEILDCVHSVLRSLMAWLQPSCEKAHEPTIDQQSANCPTQQANIPASPLLSFSTRDVLT